MWLNASPRRDRLLGPMRCGGISRPAHQTRGFCGALQSHGPRPRGPRPPRPPRPRERMYVRTPISATTMTTPTVRPPNPCPPSAPKPRRNDPLDRCTASSRGAMEVTSKSLPKGIAGAERRWPAAHARGVGATGGEPDRSQQPRFPAAWPDHHGLGTAPLSRGGSWLLRIDESDVFE